MVLLLVFYLATAPFAFVLEGQRVYVWPDDRITALGVGSILVLLLLAGVSRRGRYLRLAGASFTAISGFVLILFLIFNYGTNAPDGVFPALFSTQAATTAENVLDGLRFSPVYGLPLQALAWFGATILSFFALRMAHGKTVAAVEAGLLATLILSLYALGVYAIIPQWSGRAITGLQYGTSLGWFTNDDLLLCASAAFVALFLARTEIGQRRRALPSAR